MPLFSKFLLLTSGLLVLASTVGADTTSLSNSAHPLQPSHLPWTWNNTSSVPDRPVSTTITPTNESKSTFVITVGDGGELVFSPPSLNASVGSVITFNFLASNHTLTQSNLTSPCLYDGGFDSGFRQFNPTNTSGKHIVEFKVQTKDPQWFFCAQRLRKSHCHAGMVFSLNPGGNHSSFMHNAHTTIAAEPQSTLFCSEHASDQSTPNATATAAPSGTISAKVGPNSTIMSPPISNSGSRKPVIELGLVAVFYVLFM